MEPQREPIGSAADVIERSVDLPADPDLVWELLVDDEERAGWFGGTTTVVPRPGGEATFTDPDGTRRQGRVDRVEEGRELAWTWWPEDDPDGRVSHVAVRLLPIGDGTRLIVTETPSPTSARVHASAASATVAHASLLDLEAMVLCRAPRPCAV